jgi:hypothetical protein
MSEANNKKDAVRRELSELAKITDLGTEVVCQADGRTYMRTEKGWKAVRAQQPAEPAAVPAPSSADASAQADTSAATDDAESADSAALSGLASDLVQEVRKIAGNGGASDAPQQAAPGESLVEVVSKLPAWCALPGCGFTNTAARFQYLLGKQPGDEQSGVFLLALMQMRRRRAGENRGDNDMEAKAFRLLSAPPVAYNCFAARASAALCSKHSKQIKEGDYPFFQSIMQPIQGVPAASEAARPLWEQMMAQLKKEKEDQQRRDMHGFVNDAFEHVKEVKRLLRR